MIDIDSEDYKKLEERCRNHSPAYDPERIINFANSLPLMILKYDKRGKVKNITTYKSEKVHIKHSDRKDY